MTFVVTSIMSLSSASIYYCPVFQTMINDDDVTINYLINVKVDMMILIDRLID